MESDGTNKLAEAKQSVIEDHRGNLGLHDTIAGDEVDVERVSGRLPAVMRPAGERGGGARRGGVGHPHQEIVKIIEIKQCAWFLLM